MSLRPSKTGDLEAVVRAYGGCARQELLKYFLPNSCIAATRITIAFMHEFGFTARPWCVRVTVHNPAYVRRWRNLGRAPTDAEEAEWFAEDGALTLELGFSAGSGDGIGGHVVAVVEDSYLVDASLEQVNRRKHGIVVPPVFVGDLKQPQPSTRKTYNYFVGETMLVYEDDPTEKDYTTSPDWSSTPESSTVVDKLVEGVDRFLGNEACGD